MNRRIETAYEAKSPGKFTYLYVTYSVFPVKSYQIFEGVEGTSTKDLE